jgi:predicted dehydrogenase
MLSGGHESWHPSPAFYYARGGGPLFDMGPYYIAAFINLLGPISRVTGFAKVTRATRTITSQPLKGESITVETPTHITAIFDFASGATGQLTTSFDTPVSYFPNLVVHGSEGAMVVPDPNGFGGTIELRRRGEEAWTPMESTRPYADNRRGVGVLDMALALKEGRPHRASGALALHVLEAMHAVLRSAKSGRHVVLESTVERPSAMPPSTLE